jgi:hypothetical protein
MNSAPNQRASDHHAGEGHDMGGMGHGSGLKGLGLMLLCCLPMIAIFILLAVGLLR